MNQDPKNTPRTFPRHRPRRTDRPAILLVDDDDELRSDLDEVLTSAGFNIVGAADHHEALRILESGQRLDLLMADLVLPHGISGLLTAHMARVRRPELRVLYITGYDLPAKVGHSVLRKPLIPEVIIERIENMLN